MLKYLFFEFSDPQALMRNFESALELLVSEGVVDVCEEGAICESSHSGLHDATTENKLLSKRLWNFAGTRRIK